MDEYRAKLIAGYGQIPRATLGDAAIVTSPQSIRYAALHRIVTTPICTSMQDRWFGHMVHVRGAHEWHGFFFTRRAAWRAHDKAVRVMVSLRDDAAQLLKVMDADQ